VKSEITVSFQTNALRGQTVEFHLVKICVTCRNEWAVNGSFVCLYPVCETEAV
jgi:hypothetical protein